MIGVCRATVFRKEPDAIVLFGALMWSYAMRRELEDIDAGVISSEVEEDELAGTCISAMEPVTE